MTEPPAPRWRLVRRAAALVALALLLVVVAAAASVEDWSRDLRASEAATARAHPDERLRPIDEVELDPRTLSLRIEELVAQRLGWRHVSTDVGPRTATVRFEARSRLLFTDDIEVRLAPSPGGVGLTIEAGSRSRVAVGDLGANPRNLRALLEVVRTGLIADGGL